MLGQGSVFAVAAVKDMAVAKGFYEGTLGLEPGEAAESGNVLYACHGGGTLLVYQSSYAGTNQATTAGWEVNDIEAEIAELKGSGVRFEQYDMPGVERVGDVHLTGGIKAAWFSDPDGNILSLVQQG